MDSTNEIEVLIIITVFHAVCLWMYLVIRERKINAFDRRCRQTILDKPTFPWPEIHRISEQIYLDRELKKYEGIKPSYQEMLFSFRKLTIENWFSVRDQKHLFGLSTPTMDHPPANKDECRQNNSDKPKHGTHD